MSATSTPRKAWVEQIMGMPISVHLRGDEAGGLEAERAVSRVFADLRHVDTLFSTYRKDSQVSRINKGTLPDEGIDPMVRAVITLCDQAKERTDGYFDADLPAPEGGRWFDPSGLVKGWAVERASLHLRQLSGVAFCLNAGGDIVVGGPVGGSPWKVGVEDPDNVQNLLAVVEVTSGAVATSGSARRGVHIVDPFTGAPAAELRSVTIVGESLTWADVYATAAVARGRYAVDWLAGVAGYEALLVTGDGLVFATPGWPSPVRRARA